MVQSDRPFLRRRAFARIVTAALVGIVLLPCLSVGADKAKPKGGAPAGKKANKMQALAAMRKEMPPKSPYFAFTSADLDSQLNRELAKLGREPGPPVHDEGFVRRVYLDLTGKLPSPQAVTEFVQSTEENKRGKLIDHLLATDEFARNWARYWRDVILYNATADKKKFSAEALENWLVEQFQKDRGWDLTAAEMLMADGKDSKLGRDNFLLARDGSPTQVASETARVFMGINIQCAECHNHPFDQWKREQFHEMAAFFAKDKYFMPDAKDPSKKTEMKPQFLLGEKPKKDMKADERRTAVAAYLIYNPKNYWFARAYVNRTWNELFGDGFYKVDSLGPDNEVLYPSVVNRLSAAFRAMDFRPKWLFRTIMNSQAYQRESHTPASESQRFAALRPARLRGDQVADALEQVLGDIKRRDRVKQEFSFDPSLPQDDIDGSIQQALLLMNSPAVQGRMDKRGPLGELLKLKSDKELVSQLYLRVLARQPTDAERSRATAYLKKVGNRDEAAEDLLWTLVNSAEFLTKR